MVPDLQGRDPFQDLTSLPSSVFYELESLIFLDQLRKQCKEGSLVIIPFLLAPPSSVSLTGSIGIPLSTYLDPASTPLSNYVRKPSFQLSYFVRSI